MVQRSLPKERELYAPAYRPPTCSASLTGNCCRFSSNDANDSMSHGTYDEYWQSRKVPRTLKNIDHKCSSSQSGL
jgi:hypothetical protein